MAAEKGNVLAWDEVSVDEPVTQDDYEQSRDISNTKPVGLFLCSITGIQPVEKNLKVYTCATASLDLRIDDVLEIEKPVFDDDGKPVLRNGEQLVKAMPVDGEEKAKANAVSKGTMLDDDVMLYHPSEKENTKRRRLYVAQQIGIIGPNDTKLTGDMWKKAVGMQVLVRTEWNSWKDKDTGEVKRNVKVGWDGYKHVSTLGNAQASSASEADFSNI